MSMYTLPLLMISMLGCAEMSVLSSDVAEYNDDATADMGGDMFRESLRLDVHPIAAPSPNGLPLLAQSFWLDPNEDWESLRLVLEPTITVSGTVSGFVANPYSAGPTVPGQDNQPILAEVELYQPDTISAAQVLTDEDGFFSLQVPAGTDYRLVVRPLDAGLLPLIVVDDLALTDEQVDLNTLLEEDEITALDVPYGDPVYGQITDVDGNPVGGEVRLLDALTLEETSRVQTDEMGYYHLRAIPGEYILEMIGATPRAIPTVRQQISFEEGIGGAQYDINIGDLRQVVIGGQVRSHEGAILSDATVRLTSVDLSHAEGSLVLEDQTNNSGDFLLYALPGEWTVEVIPFNESLSPSSPIEFGLTIGDDDLNLPIELTEKTTFERQVFSVSGEPASDVVITFIQDGFNQTTTSTQTDELGTFSVDLADAPMHVLLTPTNDTISAITRFDLLSPLQDPMLAWSLADGAALDGSVRVNGEEEAGTFVVDVLNQDHELYGSILTTPLGASANFTLRVDLESAQ